MTLEELETANEALRAEVNRLRLELQETVAELVEAKKHVATAPGDLPVSTQDHNSSLEEDNLHLLEAKNALERENRELARSNAELEAFVHIASHDLREPLRNIFQYARFLEEDHHDSLNEEGLEMFDSIQRQSDHLSSLLDDLRTYAAINRSQNALRPTDLNALVQTALEQLTSLISESGATVRIHNALPTIPCRPSHMSTVF